MCEFKLSVVMYIYCVSCFAVLFRLTQLLGCGVRLIPMPTKAWYYHHILGITVQLACREQAVH